MFHNVLPDLIVWKIIVWDNFPLCNPLSLMLNPSLCSDTCSVWHFIHFCGQEIFRCVKLYLQFHCIPPFSPQKNLNLIISSKNVERATPKSKYPNFKVTEIFKSLNRNLLMMYLRWLLLAAKAHSVK